MNLSIVDLSRMSSLENRNRLGESSLESEVCILHRVNAGITPPEVSIGSEITNQQIFLPSAFHGEVSNPVHVLKSILMHHVHLHAEPGFGRFDFLDQLAELNLTISDINNHD